MKNNFSPDSKFDVVRNQGDLEYDGMQCGALLLIDWGNETVDVDYRHKTQNTVEFYEFHGHQEAYGLGSPDALELADVIEGLMPLIEDRAEHYKSEWDGNNHVARFKSSEDENHDFGVKVEAAINDIEQVPVWQAGDWLEDYNPTDNGLTADSTDEKVYRIAKILEDEAEEDQDTWVTGIEEYLFEARQEMNEEEEV